MMFFLMWGLSSSCVREDYSNCYNRYYVDLSYMGDGIKEIFNDKMSKVQMYIFNSETDCISATELTEREIQKRQAMLPPLNEGDYRIVFLGNPHSTFVGGLTSSDLEQVLFAAEDYVNGETVSGNDSLYFASMSYAIEPFHKKRQPVYRQADFHCAHYDVSVEVTGVPPVTRAAGSYPVIKIEGLSPYTDFTQRVCGEPAVYQLETRYDGVNTMTASCSIMRHLNHEDVWLKIYSPFGEELASVNFATFITTNKDLIDCSKEEVLIPFKVEFKSIGIEITVPEWVVKDLHPEY